MTFHIFSFNHLPAHKLVPYLVRLGSLYQTQSEHNSLSQTKANTVLPWHICWLNNDSLPVIGLLPKVAWTVSPTEPVDGNNGVSDSVYIEILKTARQAVPNNSDNLDNPDNPDNCSNLTYTYDNQTYQSSYAEWISELIDYSNAQQPQNSVTNTNSYQNGLMGFIGYDLSAQALSPTNAIAVANQHSAFMGHYDIYLTYEANQGWLLHTQQDTSYKAINTVKAFLQFVEQQLSKPDSTRQDNQKQLLPPPPPLVLEANWHIDDYTAAFEKTQYFLYQGDSYQINLTQKWQGQLPCAFNNTVNLVDYLPSLHLRTQAPFAGYLGINTNSKEFKIKDINSSSLAFELLSCSPELFVVFTSNDQGEQQILTKPIKGTMPRGTTPEKDEALKQQLINSDKDRAENVMIVDLLRNDLGRYAKTGSVQVPHLFAIESFSNVHHMVSSITATIKDNIHPLTVLFDSLPAGSITGTPKKRAVEIISELESGPRGAYCGTLGYMNFDGYGQWNVLIRSLQANRQGHVELWAGGGITVSSEYAAEYQECKDKVGNLLSILSHPNP